MKRFGSHDPARWSARDVDAHTLEARAAVLSDAARPVQASGEQAVSRIRAEVLRRAAGRPGLFDFRRRPILVRVAVGLAIVLMCAATADGAGILWRRHLETVRTRDARRRRRPRRRRDSSAEPPNGGLERRRPGRGKLQRRNRLPFRNSVPTRSGHDAPPVRARVRGQRLGRSTGSAPRAARSACRLTPSRGTSHRREPPRRAWSPRRSRSFGSREIPARHW